VQRVSRLVEVSCSRNDAVTGLQCRSGNTSADAAVRTGNEPNFAHILLPLNCYFISSTVTLTEPAVSFLVEAETTFR
jgi:hypothetical protein